MSANQCPSDIHASIKSAVEVASNGIMSGKMTNQRSIGAATNFSSIRFMKYTKAVSVVVAALLIMIVVLALLKLQFGATVAIIAAVVLFVGWISIAWRVYAETISSLTWPELDSLRVAMNLNEDQVIYLDCIAYLERESDLGESEVAQKGHELTLALDRILRSDDADGSARRLLVDCRSTFSVPATVIGEKLPIT